MGGKSSKKVTVGYRYSWDLHAAIGRGPINEIVAITADKKNVFAGAPNELSSNTAFYINKPNLFGGEDVGGEGGVQGTIEILMGEADQVPTARLLGLLKGLVPGFRGIVTTFYSGLISCYSSSPKPWTYRCRRTDKGWSHDVWNPEKCKIILRDEFAEIGDFSDEADARYGFIEAPYRYYGMTDAEWTKVVANYNKELLALEKKKKSLQESIIDNIRTIHAMNPAHILIECATNNKWGRGLLFDEIDLDSYKKAADTLYSEGFGLCFRYNRQNSLDTFIQQILDHIGAAQYADLSTGKLTLKLIRDDYEPDSLPLFTMNNGILSVQDDDSAGIDSAPNEIIVTYHNPVTNLDSEVRAQNLGAIQSVGLITSCVEYKAIPTHELAAKVAQRDLEMSTAGVVRLVLRFDRRGGELMPASVFRVSLPERDIDNMILRVGNIEENDDGAFTISAIQDIFGLPASSYSSGNQQGSQWTPPDNTLTKVNDAELIELPYAFLATFLSSADLDYLKSESSYLGVMATAPTDMSINYSLLTRAAGAEFINRGLGDWTNTGALTKSIAPLQSTIYIDSEYMPKASEGIIIDDEILRIDNAKIDNGELVLTVGRGCVDTLPLSHAKGAKVRFFTDDIEMDKVEYLHGETVNVKLLTQTNAGTLSADLAPIETIIMQGRQSRPYLPGNICINNELHPSIIEEANTYQLTFSHRDRILQADQLVDCLADNIGPETGTQYLIEITNKDGLVWSLLTDSNSIELPYGHDDLEDGESHVLTLKTVCNDLTSINYFSASLPKGSIIKPKPEPEPELEENEEAENHD